MKREFLAKELKPNRALWLLAGIVAFLLLALSNSHAEKTVSLDSQAKLSNSVEAVEESSSAVLSESTAKASEVSPTNLLAKGKIFHHPMPGEVCLKTVDCKSVAADHCLSKKAKYFDCSEQYRGTWITTCECL